MVVAPIVRAGSPVLRTPAALVPKEMLATRELDALVARMVATMRDAPGVGLAAPQIGVSLAILVLEDRDDLMGRLSPEARAERGRVPFPLTAIVNPTIALVPGPRATFFEGCLSVPGYMALVERALEVHVTGVDPKGEPIALSVSGWPARILQHEIDHLGGTLYVDRMLSRSLATNDEVMARWLSASTDEVRRALGA
jgi:peptide deformylase